MLKTIETSHKTAPGRGLSALSSLMLAAAALLLSGCAALNSYPPAPQTVESQDHRYKIGPLDTLNILVWRNPELSATVTVRPDGAHQRPAGRRPHGRRAQPRRPLPRG